MPSSSRPPDVKHKIRKTVGIDFGTTNSVIALLDPTDSLLVTGQDEHGCKTFPSVLGYLPDRQRPVLGRPAVALKGQPETVASVKRYLGLDRLFDVGPEKLTPPQVSARFLTALRDILAATLNDSRYLLDSAIITLPASFNHNQIEATRQAGELAGYEVVELLHEPTAAAIYYAWLKGHGDATYLVYDLGGGTFDVSIIRRRNGDYDVLSVSGDPFLGGDDFDRLLASHLQEQIPGVNFDRTTPAGAGNLARLTHVAEQIKIDLSERKVVVWSGDQSGTGMGRGTGTGLLPVPVPVPDFLRGPFTVERAVFNRLIRDKVDRTIHCCHEALARARDKAGIRLADIDYVILAGGSSWVPLVRDTVRAAFCNPELPEHVRHPELLLSEPDLCIAYGAALRAATYGTRFVFPELPRARSFLPDLDLGLGLEEPRLDLELHLTSPPNVRDTAYTLTGCVRGLGAAEVRHGGSIQVCDFATGAVAETPIKSDGTFAHSRELRYEQDNVLELRLCDNGGQELLRVPYLVRHSCRARPLAPTVLPAQLITKPLQIEVLNGQRQRVKQVVVPVGAALPATFSCTCRTIDQSGRIVVPIFEENRVIKQVVIRDLDRRLPIGSPVEVELDIDVKHVIRVRVQVREAGRCETAAIEGPPPPRQPTKAEVEEVLRQIDLLLPSFSGSYRSRVRSRVAQLRQDLDEALHDADDPKAIQRMAELRDVREQLTAKKGQDLDPPWTMFEQLVQDCLYLADTVARTMARDRLGLADYIHVQQRYAEQAYEDKDPGLYQECWHNLTRYAGSLEALLREYIDKSEPGPPRAPEDQAREDVNRFRAYLGDVWKRVRAKVRSDLEAPLRQLADQAKGLSQRAQTDSLAVIREVRRLAAEVAKVEQHLKKEQPLLGADAGLLEGWP
jgi:molecular chaperone DnaK